jgi:hypothetical protein
MRRFVIIRTNNEGPLLNLLVSLTCVLLVPEYTLSVNKALKEQDEDEEKKSVLN